MTLESERGDDQPWLHRINLEQALETLDHIEMVALSEMYERWALTEPDLDSEKRTLLVQLAADYERIAAYCGPAWQATDPESEDVVRFLAHAEVAVRRSRGA